MNWENVATPKGTPGLYHFPLPRHHDASDPGCSKCRFVVAHWFYNGRHWLVPFVGSLSPVTSGTISSSLRTSVVGRHELWFQHTEVASDGRTLQRMFGMHADGILCPPTGQGDVYRTRQEQRSSSGLTEQRSEELPLLAQDSPAGPKPVPRLLIRPHDRRGLARYAAIPAAACWIRVARTQRTSSCTSTAAKLAFLGVEPRSGSLSPHHSEMTPAIFPRLIEDLVAGLAEVLSFETLGEPYHPVPAEPLFRIGFTVFQREEAKSLPRSAGGSVFVLLDPGADTDLFHCPEYRCRCLPTGGPTLLARAA